ncbi:MAG TPA: Crp/Fnr family transcriptional regulator [Hyphomicrobiales bacterium]
MSPIDRRDPIEATLPGKISRGTVPLHCFLSQIEPQGEHIDLRPHQRFLHNNANRDLIAVLEGTLAIEAILPTGRRQILEFLLPGDVVTTTSLPLPPIFPAVSIRAMTKASAVCLDHRATAQADRVPEEYWEMLFVQMQTQLARANAHRLMIGHLDTTSRVASFLLSIALRTCGAMQSNLHFALPMSRDDIADYLAMNSDTLSRIMMRFESLTLIKRLNRHEVRVGDINALKRLTPIAQLLSTMFERSRLQLAS